MSGLRLRCLILLGALAAAVGLAAAPATAAASGTFTATGSMHAGHTQGKATLLPDGQVLVAGGTSVTGTFALSSAELYNPATGTWAVTGSMHQGCSGINGAGASATLLPAGQVLMAGGTLFDHPSVGHPGVLQFLASAELYTP
jgi:Kelch motif